VERDGASRRGHERDEDGITAARGNQGGRGRDAGAAETP